MELNGNEVATIVLGIVTCFATVYGMRRTASKEYLDILENRCKKLEDECKVLQQQCDNLNSQNIALMRDYIRDSSLSSATLRRDQQNPGRSYPQGPSSP